MIFSKIDLLIEFTTKLPIKVFLILVIIILIFIIKKLFYFNIGIRHKIHNFYLNWFLINFYISYYIIFILVLRYQTWGQTFDLKIYFNKSKDLWFKSPLIFIIFILLIIIIFLLLLKFRLFLLKEIRKRHIYQMHHELYNSIKSYILNCNRTGEEYRPGLHYVPYYNRLISKLFLKYPYINSKISVWWYTYIHTTFFGKTVDNPNHIIILPQLLKIIIEKIILIILIILFIYDCYFNNFNINKIFYYLPFYILLHIFFTIKIFIQDTNKVLNRIIYERYYEEDNVLYLETTTEENNIIEDYLKKGLICPSAKFKFTTKWPEVELMFFEWTQLYITNQRFVKSENQEDKHRYVYVNEHTGKIFEITQEDFMTLKNNKED